MSKPESVSSKIANFGSKVSFEEFHFFFFSPPEKPTFNCLDKKFSSMFNSEALI